MTILKNNHKSGINENNIKVATVTEEQQVQTRALTPGTLPILKPVFPITTAVQVYQVSTTGSINYPERPECNSQSYIFCKVDVTAGAKFKTISKALLKIKKLGGDDTGEFDVCPASETHFQMIAQHTNYLKTVTKNGTTYAVIDITEYVKEGKSKVFCLAIKSEDGSILILENTGTIEVSFVEDDDLIPSGKLEKQVGSKGGYSINARNGKLQYSQQIFASKGGLMPFGLSLSYNASNCDSSNPNDVANSMKGWTFNYQQSLKQWLNDMLYVDASNVVHTFKHPTNNSTVWYDATGKNGMVLVTTDTGYTMSDGKTTTLKFDTSKRLVSVEQKLSSSKTIATAIEYASDGKISKVTDGLGDVYKFYWYDTFIQVKKVGTPEDADAETTVAEITLAAERVTQVKYSLTMDPDDADSGDVVDFAYDSNSQLISVLDSASHQKAVFQYNTVGAISAVKNYVSETTDVAVDSNHFEYKLLQTRIASCRNSDVKSDAYCTMAYLFAEDGELLTTTEVKGSSLQPLRYRTKLDFEKSSGGIPDKVVGQALFNGAETIETTASVASSAFTVTNPGQFARTYVFSAAALIGADDYVAGVNQTMTVEIFKNGTKIGFAEFDPSKRDWEYVCGTFTLPSGSHQLVAKLVLGENLKATVAFGNVQVYSTNTGAQKQCVNKDTNFSDVLEFDGSTNSWWNEQDYCSLQYNGETITNVIFNAKDYALTLISRLQNPSSYNVWYNDGKNMLYQVSGVTLVVGGVTYPIEDIKICTMSTSMGKTVFEYIVPDSARLYKTRKVATATINGVRKGVVAEESVNSNFQIVKAVDEHGISTEYTYDTNGSVTKVVTTAPTGDTLNIEENSTYNDHNLLATSKHKRYLVDYTQSYTYGADYELIKDAQPNGLVTQFAYSADKDKLASIFATVDNVTSQNDITYDGDLVDTLSDTRTAVDFVYDERHNISQVDIGGTTVLSKEITYNTNGTTQSVTTYGNGQKIKKYYDKFDRLIKVSDLTTTEVVLVQYIYNDTEIDKSTFNVATFTPTVSANSPLRVVVDRFADTTWYTYDQFGQLEKTEKQNLITTRTRDDFNRVASVGVSFGGENMATTYTYASPVNDTLAAEVTAWNMPGEISTTYTRDSLQRPTETTVMVGNNGYKQALEYIPRQKRERVTNGQSSVGGLPSFTFVTTDIGTTNYISKFKEYSMSGTTATLVRTDAVEYDANGNITKYGNVTYKYDNLNRLVRENNPTIDKTTIWSYDINGNITYVREYAYTTDASPSNGTTTAFIYGTSWKDQLSVISLGTSSKNISYDASGNPTTYKGATLGWTRGRLLASYRASNAVGSTTMTYDANGIRKQKLVPSANYTTTTEYLYSGNNLLQETIAQGNAGQVSTKHKTYLYNSQGVIGFVYQGVTYTYRKNMFGDIIAIYSGATKLVEYAYDAFGNCTIVSDTGNIGFGNPFRYRGYYWDNDLQLYYLMSRYYDPQTGRFINADSLEYLDPETIGGLNLYAYCGNNPIMFSDSTGHAPEWLRDFLDKALYELSAQIAKVVGLIVTLITRSPSAGLLVAIDTFGDINNFTNAIYYNYISDGQSDLSPDSYQNGYINRWDRLDYTKKMTQAEHYNEKAWMYFSEYNLHMYGWFASSWADGKDVPLFSKLAEHTKSADITPGSWDKRWFVNLGIRFLKWLGL